MFELVVRDYLDVVDRELPGFVRGLYVVGSAALGAWQAGVSDVDTVILTSRAAGDDDLRALERVHHAVRIDGVYLEPGLASRWPSGRQVAPFVVDGALQAGKPCGELTPVLWLTLRRYGIAVRGPRVAELDVRVDPGELRQYNLDNLREYWQGGARQIRVALDSGEAFGDREVTWGVTWFVLGPARLHHTLAHGDVISKNAAGGYLGELFPRYAELAGRAVRSRAGSAEAFTAADLRAAAESVDEVAEDAWRRFGQ